MSVIEILREDGSFVTLPEIEKELIKIVLKSTNNYPRAAKMLGIGRSTLYRKVKELGLDHFVVEKERWTRDRSSVRAAFLLRLKEERKEHEAKGTLMVAT